MVKEFGNLPTETSTKEALTILTQIDGMFDALLRKKREQDEKVPDVKRQSGEFSLLTYVWNTNSLGRNIVTSIMGGPCGDELHVEVNAWIDTDVRHYQNRPIASLSLPVQMPQLEEVLDAAYTVV